MINYISLLRGINVGGHKKIKMADLRALYQSLGFADVTSYIQSGNVLFHSAETDRQIIRMQIESAIEQAYQFHVPVLLRTTAQLQHAIDHNPLLDLPDWNPKNQYALFLDRTPTAEQVANLCVPAGAVEQIALLDDLLYVYYPNGAGRSKLSTNFFERKMGLTGTMRNWRSVNKLCEMAR